MSVANLVGLFLLPRTAPETATRSKKLTARGESLLYGRSTTGVRDQASAPDLFLSAIRLGDAESRRDRQFHARVGLVGAQPYEQCEPSSQAAAPRDLALSITRLMFLKSYRFPTITK
ncbi:hypothetical protein AMAG_18066 [Allomyces macrogynus ATCC 38327]|uniref:Uncharacterized protein n=1 Tax=Allomyces macrogynus (strain ATCC 38327) TaxID=578462 RepID=A0A0L0S4V4_ALLM3|nr:hypothetical protein AMAG_18066 [Allomyces macrogynus ATCC 38327]|eukprot:KNE57537.1 hypothetical protein AMAG_18066 [Allomyces macrogynus ATCC 38327]